MIPSVRGLGWHRVFLGSVHRALPPAWREVRADFLRPSEIPSRVHPLVVPWQQAQSGTPTEERLVSSRKSKPVPSREQPVRKGFLLRQEG